MSKIAKKPIIFPAEVAIVQKGNLVTITGPKGELKLTIPNGINLVVNDNQVSVNRVGETKRVKSFHGTIARLLMNDIKGVTDGFVKVLEVVGTGFRAEMQQEVLVLSLGFSHQIKYPTPPGVTIEVSDNKISVAGIDREKVGLTADKIRSFRLPDSYKGKGIRYLGQQLKLKPGKAAAKGVK